MAMIGPAVVEGEGTKGLSKEADMLFLPGGPTERRKVLDDETRATLPVVDIQSLRCRFVSPGDLNKTIRYSPDTLMNTAHFQSAIGADCGDVA